MHEEITTPKKKKKAGRGYDVKLNQPKVQDPTNPTKSTNMTNNTTGKTKQPNSKNPANPSTNSLPPIKTEVEISGETLKNVEKDIKAAETNDKRERKPLRKTRQERK